MLVASSACGSSLEVLTAGRDGPPTLVLLHGYGSSAQEWMPFTQSIVWPGRFVFPQGLERTERPGGRAWWPLELGSAEDGLPDLAQSRPKGLTSAAAAVGGLLNGFWWRRAHIVLGGFSQGAMVASDVAFRSTARLSALVLLSGTPVDEASWRRGYAARRGLPVFIAHGRDDAVLPFSGSERMQRDLAASGLRVTWVPFDGGHEIPAEVVIALNQFLRSVREGS